MMSDKHPKGIYDKSIDALETFIETIMAVNQAKGIFKESLKSSNVANKKEIEEWLNKWGK